MPSYQFLLTVEMERESGRFAPREELIEGIKEQIIDSVGDVDGIGADGESSYTCLSVEVDEYIPPKKGK